MLENIRKKETQWSMQCIESEREMNAESSKTNKQTHSHTYTDRYGRWGLLSLKFNYPMDGKRVDGVRKMWAPLPWSALCPTYSVGQLPSMYCFSLSLFSLSFSPYLSRSLCITTKHKTREKKWKKRKHCCFGWPHLGVRVMSYVCIAHTMPIDS